MLIGQAPCSGALALHEFPDFSLFPPGAEDGAVREGVVGVEGNRQAPAGGNPEKPEIAGIGQQVKHRQEGIYDEVDEEIAVEATQPGDALSGSLVGLGQFGLGLRTPILSWL